MTAFRMLSTREFGWLVPMEASADPALDDVRSELIDAMHLLQEDRDCCSWVEDERARLRSLAERAGGWWFRPAFQKSANRCPCGECAVEEVFEHDGMIFVPLDVWREAVELNDERAAERLILQRTRGGL